MDIIKIRFKFVDEISIFLQLTATPTIDTGTAPFAAIKKKLTLTK